MKPFAMTKRRRSAIGKIALAATFAVSGCSSQDIHLHSDANQTLISGADDAMTTFSKGDASIGPTAQNTINALDALQQTVDSKSLNLTNSVSSYDALNETWDGLRFDFLKQVGLTPDMTKPNPSTEIQNQSDAVEQRIALRLVAINSVTELLETLVTTESQLAKLGCARGSHGQRSIDHG